MNKHFVFVLALAALSAVPAFGQLRATSQPVKLLESPTGLMAPVWSPDGSKIAVTTDNYAGILVADADGSHLRAITVDAGTGYKPTWSADSRTIIGRAKIQNGVRILHEMRAYDVNTGRATVAATRCRTSAEPASLSASGVYGTMVSNPSTAAASIPALAQFAGKTVINPALSPDGNTVAFQIPGKGMWLLDNNGSNLRSIGNGSHPDWLPDSRTIVYTVVEDNGSIFTASTLMSVDTATGVHSLLFNAPGFIPMTPAVAPDGSKVAFENAADAAIYTLNIQN